MTYFLIDGKVYETLENPRFSQHVHLKRGKLHGWCAHCTSKARHTALRSCVHRDGYSTCIRRLTFLKAVANRHNNEHLRGVASEDIHWVEREFKGHA